MTSDSVLTARETEILHLIYQGKPNIEIGATLGINPLTVKDHVRKILRKLQVRNRTQAIAKAITLCIVVPHEMVAPTSSKRPSSAHNRFA